MYENLDREWVSVSPGMSDKDAVKALNLVADHQLELLKKYINAVNIPKVV
ncbi:MAG: hypothetical protein ACYTXY_00360 [Nostoc sp.]